MRTLLCLGLLACAALVPDEDAHAYQEESICLHVDEAANTDDEYYFVWPAKGTWEITEVYFTPSTAVAADATDVLTCTVAVNAGVASTSWTEIVTHTTDSDGAEVAFVIGTSIDLTVTPASISQGYSVRIENTNGGSGKAWNGSYCVTAVKR